jgi:hypothetical protein
MAKVALSCMAALHVLRRKKAPLLAKAGLLTNPGKLRKTLERTAKRLR